MDKKTKRIIAIAVAAVLLIAAAVTILLVVNANSAGYRSISIAEIFGKVMTQNDGKTYEAYKNMRLADGYSLTTDPDSYTRMVLDDDKYVKLEQESHAVFEALGDAKKHLTTIRLEKGALTTEITKPLTETESYVVNTPNAVLAVRGTLFRVEVKQEANGDYYCDVYTYAGAVVSHRIMPDGTHVDEEIVIPAGYKATIKMDEIITVYLEEKIEETADNIDPLYISEVNDDDLVSMYNASRHGHEMFLSTEELWNEITDRDIDLSEYKSVYDGKDILPLISGDIGNSDSTADSSAENSESSSDISENTDSSSTSDSSEQSGDLGDDNSSVSSSEKPVESSSVPSGSNDDNTHEADPAPLPPQSSSASSPVSEPVPVESTPSTSINSVPAPGISGGSSSSASSDTPVESIPSSSTGGESSDGGSDNTSSDIPPSPPVHTHTPEETRVEPTCVDNGRITRKCSVCGELLSETAIPAKGHTEKTSVTPATCTESGKTVTECEICHEILNETVIPAKGHTETTETTPATCTNYGKTEYFCSVCETILRTVEIPATGHIENTSVTPATCTESGKTVTECEVCHEILNETVIPAKGHSFGEYISNNNATCLKDGTKTAVCADCGESDTITDEGSILPHTPETVVVPSTCVEHGSETVICKVCETIITPETELPLAEHTEVTETEGDIKTVKCSVCGEIIKQTNTDTGVVYPVEVNAEIFPDEMFRQYVLDNFDIDGDGKLSLEESGAVTSIDVSGLDVDSLEGIDVFAELEEVKYTVHVEGGELDISEIGGIDASKISNVRGGDTSGGTGIISGITEGSELGFDYDPGTGKSVSFTLVPDESSTFAPETPEGVEINAENFPDEEFREYYVRTEIDNGDGVLTQEECDAVTTIDLSRWVAVTSLEGIENFTKLETLQCSSSGLTKLDISNNTALTKLYCSDTQIDSLDVSKNMALEYLYCSNTQLTSLDVSKNMALEYLYCSNTQITSLDVSKNTALKNLDCERTQITSLDVSKNTALISLNCGNTQLTSLDVSNNAELKKLICRYTQIVSLDLRNNTKLWQFSCNNTQLTLLDVSNNISIQYFNSSSCKLAFIILNSAANISSSEFVVDGNEHPIHVVDGVFDLKSIEGFDISRIVGTVEGMDENGVISGITEGTNIAYTYDCKGIGDTTFQVEFTLVPDESSTFAPETPSITYPVAVNETNFPDEKFREYVSENFDTDGNGELSQEEIASATDIYLDNATPDGEITSLNGIELLTNLTFLDASGVLISELSLGKNDSLETLYLNNNEALISLDVSGCTALTQLDCNENPNLTSLDVSGCKMLELLYCFGNENLAALDVSQNTVLTYLYCYSTKILTLDVSNNTELTDLHCGATQIADIDLSNCIKLEYFDCDNTPIAQIYVSENTALKKLYCYSTQITSLDISKNTELEWLLCGKTKITTLDINNNKALRILECNDTKITTLDVSNNTALGRLECYNTQITSLDIGNNTALVTLYCYNTQITSLDVSNNTALTNLVCYNTQITSLDVSNNTKLRVLECYNTQIAFVDIINTEINYSFNFKASNNRYCIPANTISFDITSDLNFAGFDPTRVSNVQGADFSSENGIFDNFTADETTYTYDCKGTGESEYMETFTLVRTGESTVSLDDETAPEDDNTDSDTPAVLPPDDTDTTPPPSSADTGADAVLPEDAALPPEDIEGLRYLPLGILALCANRKRKTAFRIKRKAKI